MIVCRSCFPCFVDWGGWPKNGSPAGPISGRWSVPHPISNKRQPSPNRVSSQTHLIDIIIIVLYLGRK
nr:MAG TPA: hypothetical protein [Podoviridae sp. ctfN46]